MSGWSFYVSEHGEGPEDATPLYGDAEPCDAEDACRMAAQQSYDCHDGSEWMPGSEPLFVVLRDGIEAGRFRVLTEFSPDFSCYADDEGEGGA